MKKSYNLPIEVTLDVIGGKWKPVILCHLGNGPLRTSALKRCIPEITQKMLTQQLRELETDGIVHREIFPQVPPKVEYSLTDSGASLRNVLIAMSTWGTTHIQNLQDAGEAVVINHADFSGFANIKTKQQPTQLEPATVQSPDKIQL